MEKDPAGTQTTHIAASGMSTIALSGSSPTTDSTESDSGRSGFTATASCSHIRCLLEDMEEAHAERLVQDFLELWKARIVEQSGDGTYRISLTRRSTDGSTGSSPEEAEPCDW